MEHEWIERYLYAATRRLPAKMREDVEKELRGLIQDMLEERCGGLPPTDQDLRVVLTELGSPEELSAQYSPDGAKCLIGPPIYNTYQLVLKIVLVCVAFGVSVATLVAFLTQSQPVWYLALAGWLGTLFSGLLGGFGFVTLLFAAFYHKNIRLSTGSFSLDSLPPAPKKQAEIPRWEPIAGIALAILFSTLFLLAPQVLFIILVPVFNAAYVQSHWYILLLMAAAGILKESVRLLDGRYTPRVLASTLVANLATAVLSFWWLYNTEVINPALPGAVAQLFSGEEAWLAQMFSNFSFWLLGFILFALLLDCIVTLVKTLRK